MTSADRFTDADSLNALFPWQGGNWPTDWPATIRQKWNALTARIAARGAAHGQPEGDTVIDFDTVGNVNTWNQTSHPFTQQHIDELVSMMQLCQEKGVPLLVISAPKTTLDVISYDTYFDDYAFFKKLAGLYGASYYDFNFAKQELFANVEPDYYKDFTHMNTTGGHAFSQCMAKFLALLDEGADVDALFETPEEYLAAVNYITNVYLTPEIQTDKILLLAGSYHGPSVEAEYEFWVKAPGETEYAKISDYDTRTWVEYPTTVHGSYQFRVNARVVGSDADFERYYECYLDF